MESQSPEDKLAVLTNIFNNDLTDSVIAGTLKANNDDFDATVEKLLTLPANKQKEEQRPQPQQPQPMDPKSLDNIKRLQNMFGDLTQSVITTVYESNKRDVEGTVDTLLNFTSNEVASGHTHHHNNREAEVARQEQEIRSYEEFKRMQQRLQEEERKQAKEEELARKKAAEEDLARRKAAEESQQQLEKKAMDEHTRALQEQEKMLLEFQRKKEEQDRIKKEQQEAEKKDKAEKEAAAKAARVEKERAALQTEVEKERAAMQIALEKERVAMMMEQEKLEKAKRMELEKQENERFAKERKAAEERAEKQRAEKERKLAEERRINEEAIAYKKLVEQNEMLQRQSLQAEAERKLLEARMTAEIKREEEEKKRLIEAEKRFKEEQENIRRDWEEKVKKMEGERRLEEQKRAAEEADRLQAKRADEEERAQHEAAMKRILEMERLKLEEQRKRIDEERKSGEARLKAMEDAARQREEEEAQRLKAEEERKKAEEERKREEEERARLLQEEAQARERIKEDLRKALAQEQFAASAILVDKSADEPKVEITAELEGTDAIKGSWTLVQGVLPPQAWLGLFARRAMNTNSGYMYISGTTGEFHFKGLTPGHYEVRVFASKPVTSRIAESAALLIGPQVVRFTVQQQGSQLMMEYSLDPPASPSSRDWVGLYEKSQRRNQNYLTTVYGNNTGVMTLQQPKKVGDYEVRLFVTGAKYNDQASVQFAIEDNDQISAEVVDGVIKAKWVMRTVETAGGDWIGLFAAGGDNNNNNNNNNSNKYLVSVYTNSLSEGSIDIPIPKDTPKGLYELRLFASKVGKYVTFKTSDVITLV